MSDIAAAAASERRWWAAVWAPLKLAVVWALAVAVAAWALARASGLERGALAVQLISFTPYVAAGAVVPLAASVLTGRWVAAAISAVAMVTLVLCVAPRAFGSPSTVAGTPLRVMAVNLRLGGADAKAVVDLVRERGVDVVTVQEFTPQARDDLAAAGIDDLLPYQQLSPQPDASGSGLYSRFAVRDPTVTVNPGWGFHQASAQLAVPGAVATVEVHSVHPDPPGPRTGWAAGLRAQPPATAESPLRILAGDFNATLDHAELRRLLATGYRDAAAEVGRGLIPTWPYHGPRIAIVPKVTIDHILVSPGVGVRDFGAVTVALSDHRAVIATLVIP